MNSFKRLALVSFSTVALSASIVSLNASAEEKDLFTSLDTNADGMISKTEAEAHTTLKEMFDKVDADANGYVSKDEFNEVVLPQ